MKKRFSKPGAYVIVEIVMYFPLTPKDWHLNTCRKPEIQVFIPWTGKALPQLETSYFVLNLININIRVSSNGRY